MCLSQRVFMVYVQGVHSQRPRKTQTVTNFDEECRVFETLRPERRCKTQLVHHPVDQSQAVHCQLCDDDGLVGHWFELG